MTLDNRSAYYLSHSILFSVVRDTQASLNLKNITHTAFNAFMRKAQALIYLLIITHIQSSAM